jgi:hypothetical protein
MATAHLTANVLRLAACAVRPEPGAGCVMAIVVAMDVAGTSDPEVFCDATDAVNAVHTTPTMGADEQLRLAARLVSANLD